MCLSYTAVWSSEVVSLGEYKKEGNSSLASVAAMTKTFTDDNFHRPYFAALGWIRKYNKVSVMTIG